MQSHGTIISASLFDNLMRIKEINKVPLKNGVKGRRHNEVEKEHLLHC